MTLAYRLTAAGRASARRAGIYLARRDRYPFRHVDHAHYDLLRDLKLETAREQVQLYIERPGRVPVRVDTVKVAYAFAASGWIALLAAVLWKLAR